MNETKVLRVLKQTGKKADKIIDQSRIALKPGKRMTKWGTVYWESRASRSDKNPRKGI